jgi:hypothetical protein
VSAALSARDLAPLEAARIHKSEEKAGGPQTREQWSPLVRAQFDNQLAADQRYCRDPCEVAMLFAISDFTGVKRAALFAARVAVGAAVSSSHGGIWGVSDPLCHPPITVPRPSLGGRSRPRCMSPSSGRTALCP